MTKRFCITGNDRVTIVGIHEGGLRTVSSSKKEQIVMRALHDDEAKSKPSLYASGPGSERVAGPGRIRLSILVGYEQLVQDDAGGFV